jgi:hypothetical protein
MKRGDFLLRLVQQAELISELRRLLHRVGDGYTASDLDNMEGINTWLLIGVLEKLDDVTDPFWCLSTTSGANCAVIEGTDDDGVVIATAYIPAGSEADVSGRDYQLRAQVLAFLEGEL